MRIIGHRGARGLILENTLPSLSKAVELGCDGVEFDVRATKDGQLVLMHDKSLRRVSRSRAKVADLTLEELRQIPLKNGETAPTLDEALRVLKGTVAYIEPKVGGIANQLMAALKKHPENKVVFTTMNHGFGIELDGRHPEIIVFLSEHFQPLEILRTVQKAQTDGISLNAWLLNPLTYRMAKRRNLRIMAYTVNSRLRFRFIRHFYPDVEICTDYPDRFIKIEKAKD